MKAIERLRYFDGEYLRSFDWETEQKYHLEMRRKLNSELHLYGIVDGLELDDDADSTPGAKFFCVTKGMAIDQMGREIVLESPYVLYPEVVLARKGIVTGSADVWLCYAETQTTPSSAGYRICNDPNQNTRWREGFEVVILPVNAKFTDATEHPDTGRGGVYLGTVVIIDPGGGRYTIDSYSNVDRTYVGLRAQRIVGPANNTGTFDVFAANTTAKNPSVLTVEQNLSAGQNLIVGKDFAVDAAKVLPAIVPNTFAKTGVAKIESALFAQGPVFVNDGINWYRLKEYINSVVPEVQVGTKKVVPVGTPATPDPSTGVETLTLTSRIPNPSSLTVVAGIFSMVRLNLTDIAQWVSTIDQLAPWIFTARAQTPLRKNPPNVWDVPIEWRIGPKDNQDRLTITELEISYVAVFAP